MEYQNITLEVQAQHVALLTLRSPQTRNSLHLEMVRELNAAMDEISSRDDVGGLVLTGEGKAFSSGGDLLPDR